MNTRRIRFTTICSLAATCLMFPPTRATATTFLHNVIGGNSDGRSPWGQVTLSGSALYGMALQGGSIGGGTIFSMNTDNTGFGVTP